MSYSDPKEHNNSYENWSLELFFSEIQPFRITSLLYNQPHSMTCLWKYNIYFVKIIQQILCVINISNMIQLRIQFYCILSR